MTYHSDYPTEPIRKGNPYYRCSFCKTSQPEINGLIENHAGSCRYRRFKTKFPNVPYNELNFDSLMAHGRILTGKYLHYCYDWDLLILDESCPEFECCTCYNLEGYDERPG